MPGAPVAGLTPRLVLVTRSVRLLGGSGLRTATSISASASTTAETSASTAASAAPGHTCDLRDWVSKTRLCFIQRGRNVILVYTYSRNSFCLWKMIYRVHS